jgi:hypothetical protein
LPHDDEEHQPPRDQGAQARGGISENGDAAERAEGSAKTGDEILDSIARYCNRIDDSRH